MKTTLFKIMFTVAVTLLLSSTTAVAELLENANPPAKEFDWMELNSGEWLKGEFKEFYSGSVKFDSDEMDMVTFDIEDVRQIITKGQTIVSIENPSISLRDGLPFTTEKGKLHFKDQKIYLIKEDGSTMSIEVDQISSIIGGEEKESNYWSASIFFGMDILSGNTEQVTLTAKANAQRRTAFSRFLIDYIGTYTEVDNNTTTADNNRINSSLDVYQTSNFYWRVAFIEFLRDPFQNIYAKYTGGAGIGYDVIDTPATTWSITTGLGYQYTKFDEIEPTIPPSENYAYTPLIFLDSHFDTELSSDVDFIVNYNMYYMNEEAGRYTHHAMASLETEFISDLEFDISVIWDRTQEPIAFEDGTRPEQDDFKTMVSLGYSY